MKRLLIGLFVLLFSVDGFSAITVSDFEQINLGRVIRETETGALKFVIVSDEAAGEVWTQLKINSVNLFDASDQSKITDVNLYYDDGDGVFDSGDSGDSVISVTKTITADNFEFDFTESIDTTQKTIIITFKSGSTIPLTSAPDIQLTELNGGTAANGMQTAAKKIDIVGLDVAFDDLSSVEELVYDADATKFPLLEFKLTPDTGEAGYFIENIIVNNSQNNFDATETNHGVSALHLYKESDDEAADPPVTFDASTDTLLKSITNVSGDPVTFNSTNAATFSFDLSDGDNRKITDKKTFYVVADVGPSTNIEINDTAVQINAKVTSLTGTGVGSSYSYGPINISGEDHNNRSVSLAGMIIKSVENIFPSMNAAAGLIDIPILKFVAKSVGVKTRLKKLVISNDANTFDVNSNQSGITNLSLVLEDGCDTNPPSYDSDSCLGEYTGYGVDGPNNSPNLDSIIEDADASNYSEKITEIGVGKTSNSFFQITSESSATFDHIGTGTAAGAFKEFDDDIGTNLDVDTGKERAFYILADFGANMSSGQSVSLNISADTRASYDNNSDNDYTNDDNYSALKIGSSLPLTVAPTQSITVVDPQLTIKTPLDVAIGDNEVGLFCDTDMDANCTNGAGGTKKLVAGMYDVLMYVFDFDASISLSGVSFEFQSPNRYFSQESIGISKLSLYLDKDKNGALGSGDIFLGSTDAFTNSGKTGTISNVSLPQGKDQKLLLLFDIGQRVSDSTDQLSIQLSNVIASDNVVAGMFPNPISPYTYNVVAHKLKLQKLISDISDTNVITQASTFDVTAYVEPTEEVDEHEIQLIQVGSTGVPLSSPKFYLGGVSGSNRTYEFSHTFLPDVSYAANNLFDNHDTDSLGAGVALNLVYRVSAANITSEGNYLIDFDVYYKMTDEAYLLSSRTTNEPVNIRLTRSKGAGTDYKSAVALSGSSSEAKSDKITPSMTTTNKVYTWSLPAYIESVSVQVNNTFTSFNNYQSVPQNAQLKIQFIDSGQDIDPSSLSLQLNGTTLKSESEISVNSSEAYYEYDALSGELLVSSIGDASGTLTVSANDNFGQAYPSAPLIFFTSATLEIEKFFVYPNPFSPSIRSSGVTFGFSLTQSATVSIKVYDAMGREISQVPAQTLGMGYQTISWDAIIASSSKFIPSGTYYLKLTATDTDGASKVATTKLAVY